VFFVQFNGTYCNLFIIYKLADATVYGIFQYGTLLNGDAAFLFLCAEAFYSVERWTKLILVDNHVSLAIDEKYCSRINWASFTYIRKHIQGFLHKNVRLSGCEQLYLCREKETHSI
jgi:sarcosine oxidase delta subunit